MSSERESSRKEYGLFWGIIVAEAEATDHFAGALVTLALRPDQAPGTDPSGSPTSNDHVVPRLIGLPERVFLESRQFGVRKLVRDPVDYDQEILHIEAQANYFRYIRYCEETPFGVSSFCMASGMTLTNGALSTWPEKMSLVPTTPTGTVLVDGKGGGGAPGSRLWSRER